MRRLLHQLSLAIFAFLNRIQKPLGGLLLIVMFIGSIIFMTGAYNFNYRHFIAYCFITMGVLVMLKYVAGATAAKLQQP
jgi:predicted tellurium resistance membrane protein TerC